MVRGWLQQGGAAACPGALGSTAVALPATGAPGSTVEALEVDCSLELGSECSRATGVMPYASAGNMDRKHHSSSEEEKKVLSHNRAALPMLLKTSPAANTMISTVAFPCTEIAIAAAV
ncbi:hypothetical protein UY3_08674 [Chelonia mydas]|uniref:Uncharacterized protein n=1 Tax=Chelonia mydas TaxID=8469 RepID=M7BAH9_CHEMY|nr:hypothetical protein UY3_08674 [Chelonia mydas]